MESGRLSEKIDYSIIIPVFNEENVLPETYRRLKQIMGRSGGKYEFLFVDDGSKDASAQIIKELSKKDPTVRFIRFSKNFGQQAAMSAGLDFASGKAIVFIDADLQDPPETILEMMEKWKEGYEVVYGKRIERKGESFFKKMTAVLFYRILRRLTREEIPADVGDFRLIDRKVGDVLRGLRENNRYMRGLMSWVGFNQVEVEYVREERWAGVTKYSFRKMLKLSLDAMTSFSYKPLKLASYMGIILTVFSFFYLIVLLSFKWLTTKIVSGVFILLGITFFFDGIILMALGIIGEYIARTHEESKQRPLYIVAEKIGFQKEDNQA